jgi:hypothetical protein
MLHPILHVRNSGWEWKIGLQQMIHRPRKNSWSLKQERGMPAKSQPLLWVELSPPSRVPERPPLVSCCRRKGRGRGKEERMRGRERRQWGGKEEEEEKKGKEWEKKNYLFCYNFCSCCLLYLFFYDYKYIHFKHIFSHSKYNPCKRNYTNVWLVRKY